MAGSKIATAYVQVMPSMDGVAPAVKQHFTGAGTSAGHAFSRKFGAALKVGFAAAAAGMTVLVKESLKEGAALEQSIGGIETLFGTGGKNLQEYADSIGKSAGDARGEYEKLLRAQEEVFFNAENAYKTAGLSANEYMETVTGFSASLISSLEGDTEKAAAVADMALVDMADNANKMGTDMQLLQNAYQSFARGQYLLLDNLHLGYDGTKGEMERLLADAQKLTGIEYDIGNLADVYSAIHAIQGELGITGATALESSTTLTGSFNSMKAAFKNLLADMALGRPMEKSLIALTQTTVTYLKGNLLPAVGNIFQAIPGMLDAAWEGITGKNFEEWADGLITKLNNLTTEDLVDFAKDVKDTTFDLIKATFAKTTLGVKIRIRGKAIYLGTDLSDVFYKLGGALGSATYGALEYNGRGGSAGSNVTMSAENTIFHGIGLGGSHANGLDYVPYDGYLAELHEGEMILTRAKANAVRKGQVTGGGIIINQYFYDKYKTAADQQAAARYEQEKAVMGLV